MKRILAFVLASVMAASMLVFVPAQAEKSFEGGNVISEYDGSEIKLLPNTNGGDINVETAEILDGGFENELGFIDEKHPSCGFANAGFSFSTEGAVEGKRCNVLDMSKLNGQEGEGIMGFINVWLMPCADTETYMLEFYVKSVNGPIDGNVNVKLYFLAGEANGGGSPSARKGDTSYTITNDTFKDVDTSKWIRVRHYFQMDPDFQDNVYTLQMMAFDGKGTTTKLAFDAFSLQKISIDEATMDASLFEEIVPPTPKSIKLAKKKLTIKKGKTANLKVTVKGVSKAKVTSSNKKVVKVASVTKKAIKLKGLKKGKATITAKAGAKKATCKVTVK